MPKKDTILGLDVGSHSVKAAWAETRNGRPSIIRTEFLQLPLETSESKSVIGPWIEKMELAKFPCVIGLPGRHAMFQPLLLPPDDPRSTEQATEMEVVRFNEMASETMTYGYTSFSIRPVERRLIMAIARPTVLEELIGFSKELGLDIIDMVPSPVAMFNALELNADDHKSPYIYANIGRSATEIAIGAGSGLMFARTFSSGGQMFTDALAGDRNLLNAQAENLKLKEGSLLESDGPTAAALTPVADVWISELESCLSVYRSLFPPGITQPVRMILAGGGSELRGLPEYTGRKLGIKTSCVEALLVNAAEGKLSLFAVAAGLAISGLETAPAHISILPASVRDELIFRHQKPFWIAAGVAAALILAVSLTGGFRDFRRMENRLKTQKSGLERRQQLMAQIETVRAANQRIRNMANPVKNLIGAAPLMRDLITSVARLTAPGDWITVISDAKSYFSDNPLAAAPSKSDTWRSRRDLRADKASKENAATNRLERVVIEGYTPRADLSTVKKLIAKLNETDFVLSADLLGDELIEESHPDRKPEFRSAQRFVIDVKVAMP